LAGINLGLYLSLDLINNGANIRDMDIFTALAEPTRRSIIEMLARTGAAFGNGDIRYRFDSSPPAISQHLKVLREAKLVRMEKRSRQRIYEINPRAL
jgi:DNA-binding transcriptional ArsR family regulator